jgi:D-galactonate transporter
MVGKDRISGTTHPLENKCSTGEGNAMHYEPSVPALSPDLTVMAQEGDENSVYRKITLRIMPIIFLAYVLAFLDRINVGYTQLQMKQDLGFSDAVYGLGAGLFFITYLLFEVPSNLWLEKIGARLTFLRIMVLWGLTSAATMLVTEPWQFYTIRLLLGVFEAGFFPGVILYLTYWYPSHRRGSITGLFLFGMPITGVLGGPLSGMIMSQMHGVNGWAGWQWVFLLEGVPTAIVGVVLYLVLANRPSEAKWLSDREKAVVEGVMAADRRGEESSHGKLRAALADPKTFVLAFIYFCCACAVYTFTFWLPTMIRELGVASLTEVGWYTVIPYAFGALGILVLSRSSDRLRERRWHVASTLIVGSVSLYLTIFLGGAFWPTMALLCIAAFFNFGCALFWSIPPTYLSREAAAVGIAVISSLGILGGFASPSIIGTIKNVTGSMDAGLAVMTAVIVAGGVVTLVALPAKALRVGISSNSH